jgi:hypothetical protein
MKKTNLEGFTFVPFVTLVVDFSKCKARYG